MVAQDTGGAIRSGSRRFWGSGDDAAVQAGRMRQSGRMWVLLPNGFPRAGVLEPLKEALIRSCVRGLFKACLPFITIFACGAAVPDHDTASHRVAFTLSRRKARQLEGQ